jgi:tagatose-1,6-bisphosphate aldolase
MLDELKHSIKIHLLLMNGPSQQLCAFLIKLMDFIEDDDKKRKQEEIDSLSFSIIEGLAFYLHRYIDEQVSKKEIPMYVKEASNNLLIKIGESRNLNDKIEAKYVVLSAISNSLKRLAEFTKSDYPRLFSAKGSEI